MREKQEHRSAECAFCGETFYGDDIQDRLEEIDTEEGDVIFVCKYRKQCLEGVREASTKAEGDS